MCVRDANSIHAYTLHVFAYLPTMRWLAIVLELDQEPVVGLINLGEVTG